MKSLTISLVTLCLLAFPIHAQAQSVQKSNITANSGSSSGANANFYGGTSESIYPQNTPSPTAPPFVTASPCMGVISGAGTSPVVGIALGMSYKDKECENRANASALNSLGDRVAALQIMCQIDSVKQAMAAAGTPCSGVVQTAQVMPAASGQVQTDQPVGPGYGRAGGGITPLQQFCSTLDPKRAEDRPYIDYECRRD